MARVILLSGRISSGKSVLSTGLQQRFGARVVKTKDLIRNLAGNLPPERQSMQDFGEKLDRETKGQWVADAVTSAIKVLPADGLLVVDAIRILPQAEGIRARVNTRVLHVHLHAPKKE